MSTLIEQVQAAIAAELTAAELGAIHGRLRERIRECLHRRREITEGGPERHRAALSGDVEAVQKLESEARALAAEMEVLESLESRLRRRLDQANASEAVATMPDPYSKLDSLLEAEQAAQRAVQEARQATDQHLHGIRQSRVHLARCPVQKAPAADGALLGRFLEVRGIAPEPGRGWGRNGHTVGGVAELLGLELPRPSEHQAA